MLLLRYFKFGRNSDIEKNIFFLNGSEICLLPLGLQSTTSSLYLAFLNLDLRRNTLTAVLTRLMIVPVWLFLYYVLHVAFACNFPWAPLSSLSLLGFDIQLCSIAVSSACTGGLRHCQEASGILYIFLLFCEIIPPCISAQPTIKQLNYTRSTVTQWQGTTMVFGFKTKCTMGSSPSRCNIMKQLFY